jgi:hypothetical protein
MYVNLKSIYFSIMKDKKKKIHIEIMSDINNTKFKKIIKKKLGLRDEYTR